MKCGNCKVKISHEFSHAINNNCCPACGKNIMQKNKLSSFLSLRALLEDTISDKNVDIDKIASLIVANFEIKQVFKEQEKEDFDDDVVEEEEPEEEKDPDAEFKKRQKAESKKILQKMREEALSGALEERYGMEDNAGILIPEGDDINIFEITSKEEKNVKRESMLSGGGGFSRSDT